VAIQVKTNQRGVPEWILTQKVEVDVGDASLPDNGFFVLVISASIEESLRMTAARAQRG
jgi:hypothetical protein